MKNKISTVFMSTNSDEPLTISLGSGSYGITRSDIHDKCFVYIVSHQTHPEATLKQRILGVFESYESAKRYATQCDEIDKDVEIQSFELTRVCTRGTI